MDKKKDGDKDVITSQPKSKQASAAQSNALVPYVPPTQSQYVMQGVTGNYIVSLIPGVPPGLEVLFHTQNLFVRQTIEFMEFFYNARNKYEVLDVYGQRLFFAIESTECCTRVCCGQFAPFELQCLNFAGQAVLSCNGSPGCCEGDAHVEILYGNELMGSCVQICTCCVPVYHVLNASGQIEFIIIGPGAGVCCGACGTVDFDVFLPDNTTQVGRISKHWAGYLQEAFTEADNFGISYPVNLDTKMKAVFLGMTFLLDFQYFGKQNTRQGYGCGRRTWWFAQFVELALIALSIYVRAVYM